MKVLYVRLYRPSTRSYIKNYKLDYEMDPEQARVYLKNTMPAWTILQQYESSRGNLDV